MSSSGGCAWSAIPLSERPTRPYFSRAWAGIAALQIPGLASMTVGTDLELREGGWSFAIINDWQDAEAYRVYDEESLIQGARELLPRSVRNEE